MIVALIEASRSTPDKSVVAISRAMSLVRQCIRNEIDREGKGSELASARFIH